MQLSNNMLLELRKDIRNLLSSAETSPTDSTIQDFRGLDLKDSDDVDSQDGENLGEEAAHSIIGGSSVIGGSNRESPDPEVTTDDLKRGHFLNQHKIFTFSLPFGGNGNPLSHLPSLRTFTQGIPIFGNSSTDVIDDEFNVSLSKEEIRNKLKRQETINTLEEAYLFHGLKGQGSSRLKAVTNALTPNISLPSFDDKKKHESIWETIDGDVVILGGYRGSILRETKSHKRVWIPIRAGFNIRKIDLLIGPTDEDEEKAQKEIYSDDIMSHVGPIDICRKLMSKLNNGKTNVHAFGYDWRLSSDISSQKLFDFLQELERKRAEKGIVGKGTIVIAHSMGGLVAHHAMQKDPSLFRGLVYAGVPAECPNILGPIRVGDRVLVNSKILTAEVNFFMRSSFVFLPLEGRCFMNRRTHEQYTLDYFDVNTWIEYNLSPPVSKDRLEGEANPASPITEYQFSTSFEEAKTYLEHTLKRTKKFLLELEYDPTKEYPPLAIVYGNEVPTVRGVRVESPEGIKRGEYDDFFYGPGDGVVNHKWLMPERRGFPVNAKIASDKGHISLMCDLEAMEQALEAIIS